MTDNTRTAACGECWTYDTHLPSCSAGTGATPKVAIFDRTPTISDLEATLEGMDNDLDDALEAIQNASHNNDEQAWDDASELHDEINEAIDATTAAIDKARIAAGTAWWQGVTA